MHKVKVGRTYRSGTPHKWKASCSCGWNSLSWSWARWWDCYVVCATGPYTSQDWINDNGKPFGGAFVNALEHVGLYTDEDTFWAPMSPKPFPMTSEEAERLWDETCFRVPMEMRRAGSRAFNQYQYAYLPDDWPRRELYPVVTNLDGPTALLRLLARWHETEPRRARP